MTDDERSFGAGWSIDYAEAYDSAAVAETLESDWQRELLLADYESAGEDARNKETLLIQSFYVSMAVFGLLVNVAYRLAQEPSPFGLFALSVLGVALFGLLANWSARYRQGRDAAWDRRSEIEDFVALARPHLLRSNDSKFKRLSRVGAGRYAVAEQPWYEVGSIATIVVFVEVAIGLVWMGVAVWSGLGLA